MKKIYIQIDDEINTIVEKLQRENETSLIFIVPKKALLTSSVINLKLLAKEADRFKKNIVVISDEKRARTLAEKVGFKSYEKVEYLPQTRVLKIKKNITEKPVFAPAPLEIPPRFSDKFYDLFDRAIKRLKTMGPVTAFLAFSLVLILIIVFIVLPTATITAHIKARTIPYQSTVRIDKNVTNADFEKNYVPGIVMSHELSDTEVYSSTGQINVGENATGTLSIQNNGDYDFGLISGTRFSAKNGSLIFTATSSTHIYPFKTANVPVIASQGGTSSNLKAGERFVIVLLPNLNLTITNLSDFSGGTDEYISFIQQKDINNGIKLLKKKIIENGISQIKNKLTSGKQLVNDSIQTKIIAKKINAKVGEKKSTFTVSESISFYAIAFDTESVIDITLDELSNTVPTSSRILDTGRSSVVIKPISINKKAGFLILNVNLTAVIAPVVRKEDIMDAVLSQNKETGENNVRSISNIENFEIQFWPPFIKRFPSLESRLKIKFDYQTNNTQSFIDKNV